MTIREMRYISLPILISELVPNMILKYIKNRGPDPEPESRISIPLLRYKNFDFQIQAHNNLKSHITISPLHHKNFKFENLTYYQIKI